MVTLNHDTIDEALKAIDEIFQKKNLSQKPHLVAVVGKGHGGLSSLKWFEENRSFARSGLIREHLTHQADIIFSNDPNDRKFYLGERADAPTEEIERRFSNLKPCIWGSDGHSFDTLLHPSNGNTFDYTWIEADLSFEGLRQITYEPELRVRVQEANPSEEETYAKIENLSIDFPDDLKIKNRGSEEAIPFCIHGTHDIEFASRLTCVIGGRGSGKSTLVHFLYNCLPGLDIERLNKINSPLLDLQLDSKDVLGKVQFLTNSDIPLSTDFFLQNEVEKFARDVEAMSTLIRSRLYGLSAMDTASGGLEQVEDEWRREAADVNELISAYDEMTRVDEQLGLLERQTNTFRKQTEVISSLEYRTLQEDISRIAGEAASFLAYKREYAQISSEISTLITSVGLLDWSRYGGQPELTSLAADLQKRKEELQAAFESANMKYDEADYPVQLVEKKSQLRILLEARGLSTENIGEVAAATERIADLDQQLKALKRERVPFQEVYDRKNSVIESFRDLYKSYEGTFRSVAEKLHSSLGKLKFDDNDTNISFELRANDQLLKDEIVEFIKENNPSSVSLRSDVIQSVLFESGRISAFDLVSDQSKIVDAANNSTVADVHTQILQQLVNDTVFLEKLHLRMCRRHYDIKNIQVQTKLGDKFLQNTSFGERCGIVIAIVLVAGTNPIIIDQPEDNLDGKYISKVLVPLIREQKRNRQIILVTRDANIVIGSDAELLLILDKDDQGTALLPATIENKSLREKYIWILDGGERAFQKRQEKYSIRRAV